jgi:hypothetical protein
MSEPDTTTATPPDLGGAAYALTQVEFTKLFTGIAQGVINLDAILSSGSKALAFAAEWFPQLTTPADIAKALVAVTLIAKLHGVPVATTTDLLTSILLGQGIPQQ